MQHTLTKEVSIENSVYRHAVSQVQKIPQEGAVQFSASIDELMSTLAECKTATLQDEQNTTIETAIQKTSTKADALKSKLSNEEHFYELVAVAKKAITPIVKLMTVKISAAEIELSKAKIRVLEELPEIAELADKLKSEEAEDRAEGGIGLDIDPTIKAFQKITSELHKKLKNSAGDSIERREIENKLAILSIYWNAKGNLKNLTNLKERITNGAATLMESRTKFLECSKTLTLDELKKIQDQSAHLMGSDVDESKLEDPLAKVYFLAKQKMTRNNVAPKPAAVMKKIHIAADKSYRLIKDKFSYPTKIEEQIAICRKKAEAILEEFKMSIEDPYVHQATQMISLHLRELQQALEAPIIKALSTDYFLSVVATGNRGEFNTKQRERQFQELDKKITLLIKKIDHYIGEIRKKSPEKQDISIKRKESQSQDTQKDRLAKIPERTQQQSPRRQFIPIVPEVKKQSLFSAFVSKVSSWWKSTRVYKAIVAYTSPVEPKKPLVASKLRESSRVILAASIAAEARDKEYQNYAALQAQRKKFALAEIEKQKVAQESQKISIMEINQLIDGFRKRLASLSTQNLLHKSDTDLLNIKGSLVKELNQAKNFEKNYSVFKSIVCQIEEVIKTLDKIQAGRHVKLIHSAPFWDHSPHQKVEEQLPALKKRQIQGGMVDGG